jgi:rSAM/selenodomain-associated transferase 1
MQTPVLIIFAKNPVLGKVKTRLAATVGDVRALDIYGQLVAHTQATTQPLAVDKVVFYTDFVDNTDGWHNHIYQKQLQTLSPDLGARMLHAFEWAQAQGYGRIGIIGTDCAELTTQILQDAFDNLQHFEACVGAAHDGGYYFLGTNGVIKNIFENKQWSTETVFDNTINDLKMLDKSHHLLPALSDIDNETDWLRFEQISNKQ